MCPNSAFARQRFLLHLLLICSWIGTTRTYAQTIYEPYAFTTFAGNAATGYADGQGSAARFAAPAGVAVDVMGNVYVADTRNHAIRRITPAGVVTTLAGLAGNQGHADGSGSNARFFSPQGIAVDAAGNLYVADTVNCTIRKITSAGVVSTFAGVANNSGSNDGNGSAAQFSFPQGVTVDAVGNVYVADTQNSTIRKITAAGDVSTLAGMARQIGSVDGTGTMARFNSPSGITADSAGNLYVADSTNHTIRKITPAGVVSTFAGLAGSSGTSDGTGSSARFRQPTGVTGDHAGNLYVADSQNHTIRKITPAAVVSTFAGSAGNSGSSDGNGSSARFNNPADVAVDQAGNLYVADSLNSAIRNITPAADVSTLAGLPGGHGSSDGTGSAARFNVPEGLALDAEKNLYVADVNNETIRKINPIAVVTTWAGAAGQPGSVDGTGNAARFSLPCGVALDAAGNVYVSELNNNTIRKISPAAVVTTFAGLPGAVGSADGVGSAARFNAPRATAVARVICEMAALAAA